MLSVIVPTCHRNDLLARCLDRLAPGAQSLPASEYEVVVTDDGSKSSAEELVRSRYPWAHWAAGPRRGPGANRNAGARRGTGEWLVFTDDDCLPSPGWLEGFARSVRLGVPIYEGRTTCEAGVASPLEHAPVNETGGWLWSCNMMVRCDVYQSLGGFDEEFPHPHMEDVDFRERAVGAGHEFVFVPEAVVDHPPRLMKTGAAIAKTHESEYLFYYKCGGSGPFASQHLRRLLGFRGRALLRCRRARHLLPSLGSTLTELAYVVRHAPEWDRKYKARYATGRAATYPPDMAVRVGMR